MKEVSQSLEAFTRRLLPRILTQVCRDPHSPAYGCCDRNWWHYKIRDFPSIILQQGGYALYCASQLPIFEDVQSGLLQLAKASCRFWVQRAARHGAFEEYYPYEEGYPPLAFSALCIAKMTAAGVMAVEELGTGLNRAANQLQKRFEHQALNQQVAGTAALSWIKRIAPALVEDATFTDICAETLSTQHSEGWFMEYGGPDLGYLSVTLDCLWDAYDATDDIRFKDAAFKALNFIAPFMVLPGRGAGMHNSRNTDYLVPYGISRCIGDPTHGATAQTVLHRLLNNLDKREHYLHAVDDRYFCHYIGASVLRTLPLIANMTEKPIDNTPAEAYFHSTGHWLRPTTPSGCASLVSGQKGGILTLWFETGTVSDYGWVIEQRKKLWVSHWWTDTWDVTCAEDHLKVEGPFVKHAETVSTPYKHIVLRLLSYVFGRHLIPFLKKLMIFNTKIPLAPSFSRNITFEARQVKIIDRIGLPAGSVLRRAPRSSKRHVASADSYHNEDLELRKNVELTETRKMRKDKIEITTVYRAKS